MIEFVNAKINIGLAVTGRRANGYHDLETLFYPVGLHAGKASNPVEFCDILEVTPRKAPGYSVKFTGRPVDCPPEKNLVTKAANLYFSELATSGFGADIRLEKHLPDGAGMGGGSADASFTLKALSRLDAELNGDRADFIHRNDRKLAELALRLGADCPFFIYNRPMFASGLGEKFEETDLDLSGCWLAVAMPRVSVSTKEAFAGIIPAKPAFDLRRLGAAPIEDWQSVAVNDFEKTIFAIHHELEEIKIFLRESGALYASMTGSGSAVFGIFPDAEGAELALDGLRTFPTIRATYLLEL